VDRSENEYIYLIHKTLYSLPKTLILRACLDFAFEPIASKFCSGQGAMRKHSHSYATDLPAEQVFGRRESNEESG
jgi:hypothetical protein